MIGNAYGQTEAGDHKGCCRRGARSEPFPVLHVVSSNSCFCSHSKCLDVLVLVLVLLELGCPLRSNGTGLMQIARIYAGSERSRQHRCGLGLAAEEFAAGVASQLAPICCCLAAEGRTLLPESSSPVSAPAAPEGLGRMAGIRGLDILRHSGCGESCGPYRHATQAIDSWQFLLVVPVSLLHLQTIFW
ncbi:hypothetical protein D3C85_1123730 [compost metagenome]